MTKTIWALKIDSIIGCLYMGPVAGESWEDVGRRIRSNPDLTLNSDLIAEGIEMARRAGIISDDVAARI